MVFYVPIRKPFSYLPQHFYLNHLGVLLAVSFTIPLTKCKRNVNYVCSTRGTKLSVDKAITTIQKISKHKKTGPSPASNSRTLQVLRPFEVSVYIYGEFNGDFRRLVYNGRSFRYVVRKSFSSALPATLWHGVETTTSRFIYSALLLTVLCTLFNFFIISDKLTT